MSVTAPPRPPRPSNPLNRDELEALVEALIEEARQRARRRRRIYGAVAAVMGLVAVVVVTVFEHTAQSKNEPALSARSTLPPERRARRSPSVAPRAAARAAPAPSMSRTPMAVGSGS